MFMCVALASHAILLLIVYSEFYKVRDGTRLKVDLMWEFYDLRAFFTEKEIYQKKNFKQVLNFHP